MKVVQLISEYYTFRDDKFVVLNILLFLLEIFINGCI